MTIFASVTHITAQQIKVNGGFIEDTTKIGESVNFYLTAEYPVNLEVIFPDSNYNFAPYEFLSKTYDPSKRDSSVVFDSAVYELVTFEIDQWQKLVLPVFLLKNRDSIKIESNADSIYLMQLVPEVTDTTSLIANLDYSEVDTQFNYPVIYIMAFVLFALIILFLVIFGKRIGKRFTLQRLRREYQKFSTHFDQVIADLRTDNSPQRAEFGLNLWKKYLERLDKQPYTKLTTKELIKSGIAEIIISPLHNIDKSIYGQVTIDNIHKDFEKLEDYTLEKYHRKLEEVRNG